MVKVGDEGMLALLPDNTIRFMALFLLLAVATGIPIKKSKY